LQLATSAKVLDNQVSVSQRKIQRDTLLGHSMVGGSNIVQKMIILMKFLEHNIFKVYRVTVETRGGAGACIKTAQQLEISEHNQLVEHSGCR